MEVMPATAVALGRSNMKHSLKYYVATNMCSLNSSDLGLLLAKGNPGIDASQRIPKGEFCVREYQYRNPIHESSTKDHPESAIK